MTQTFNEDVLIDAAASSDSYQLQMQSDHDQKFLRFVEYGATSAEDVLVEQAPYASDHYAWEWRKSGGTPLLQLSADGNLRLRPGDNHGLQILEGETPRITLHDYGRIDLAGNLQFISDGGDIYMQEDHWIGMDVSSVRLRFSGSNDTAYLEDGSMWVEGALQVHDDLVVDADARVDGKLYFTTNYHYIEGVSGMLNIRVAGNYDSVFLGTTTGMGIAQFSRLFNMFSAELYVFGDSTSIIENQTEIDDDETRKVLSLINDRTPSSGSLQPGFGTMLDFSIKHYQSQWSLAKIAAVRQSASNEGDLVFSVANGGEPAEGMRLTQEGYLGINKSSPAQRLHVYGTSMASSSGLFERVEAQQYGPRLTLRQARSTGGAGQDQDYLGHIHFRGYNDAGTPEEICYAAIEAKIVDASDGTEDGTLYLATMKNGTLSNKVTVGNTYVTIHNGTENLAFIDAGSDGASEQDWVQVQVGGVTGYLHVYAGK